QFLDGLFLYPSTCIITGARFLYYFCLCKSVKELFPLPPAPKFWAKADAKVQTFSIPSKFSTHFFKDLTKVFRFIDKIKAYTLLYII
ncbi:MAG: hypothetical protein J6W38_10945, partial [Prevotella sp.]|nr:hypothetical protein [Prevotella sp.]